MIPRNNVFQDYYGDPDATRAAFVGDSFRTGDLGVMPRDGYEIRDRLKDIVITWGEDVSRVGVEQALMAHPAVAEAAVVVATDEQWAQVVEPKELVDFARGRLAGFNVPKQVELVGDLPRAGTGMVQNFVLRERLRMSVASEGRRTG
jgi:fatty-acyl-CoA synthase